MGKIDMDAGLKELCLDMPQSVAVFGTKGTAECLLLPLVGEWPATERLIEVRGFTLAGFLGADPLTGKSAAWLYDPALAVAFVAGALEFGRRLPTVPEPDPLERLYTLEDPRLN
jgi:hypothetical protein